MLQCRTHPTPPIHHPIILLGPIHHRLAYCNRIPRRRSAPRGSSIFYPYKLLVEPRVSNTTQTLTIQSSLSHPAPRCGVHLGNNITPIPTSPGVETAQHFIIYLQTPLLDRVVVNTKEVSKLPFLLLISRGCVFRFGITWEEKSITELPTYTGSKYQILGHLSGQTNQIDPL